MYEGQRTWLSSVFAPLERLIYRALRIDGERDMTAPHYTRAPAPHGDPRRLARAHIPGALAGAAFACVLGVARFRVN